MTRRGMLGTVLQRMLLSRANPVPICSVVVLNRMGGKYTLIEMNYEEDDQPASKKPRNEEPEPDVCPFSIPPEGLELAKTLSEMQRLQFLVSVWFNLKQQVQPVML